MAGNHEQEPSKGTKGDHGKRVPDGNGKDFVSRWQVITPVRVKQGT